MHLRRGETRRSQVRDLQSRFRRQDGTLRALRGVSLDIQPARSSPSSASPAQEKASSRRPSWVSCPTRPTYRFRGQVSVTGVDMLPLLSRSDELSDASSSGQLSGSVDVSESVDAHWTAADRTGHRATPRGAAHGRGGRSCGRTQERPVPARAVGRSPAKGDDRHGARRIRRLSKRTSSPVTPVGAPRLIVADEPTTALE